jgi:1D-myo-inositol-tetrakisphosphate 5-kinase/inositol-polyphosphate multikinase
VNTPKAYGKSIKPSDLPDGIARFFPLGTDSLEGPPEEPKLGLPHHVLLPVLKAIRGEIAEVRSALAKIEFRMVGGSILIIYEAEWERADAAIKRYVEESKRAPASEKIGEEEEDEEEEEDDEEDDDEENIPPPAFCVKLIDFAHTRVEAGLGPDEGVLVGVDTVLRLLDGRIQQLEQ